MLTASQCRAARSLLDWTQQELADAARIGVATIRQFEGGATEPRHATLAVLRQVLELAGIEFIDENGTGEGVGSASRAAHGESSVATMTAGAVDTDAAIADNDALSAVSLTSRKRIVERGAAAVWSNTPVDFANRNIFHGQNGTG